MVMLIIIESILIIVSGYIAFLEKGKYWKLSAGISIVALITFLFTSFVANQEIKEIQQRHEILSQKTAGVQALESGEHQLGDIITGFPTKYFNELGSAYNACERGDCSQAKRVIELQDKRNPRSVIFQRHVLRAYVDFKERDFLKAKAILEDIHPDKDSFSDNQFSAIYFHTKGEVYYALKDCLKSREAFEQLMNRDPKFINNMEDFRKHVDSCQQEI